MKRALFLTLLALSLSASPAVRAFIQLRTPAGKDEAWDLDSAQQNVVGGKLTYYLHPDGSQDLSNSQAFAAVRAAISSWESVEDSRLAFVEDGSRAASSHKSGDRVNLVKWVDGQLDPFTLGTTFPTFSDGHLRDADLLLNDAWFRWSVANPGSNGRADIEGVVAHEWGHLIGLDHVSIQGSTMYYSAPLSSIYFRTLHEDDEAAVASLYPASSFAASRATIRGTVDVAGKSNDRGGQVIAIDAVSGEVAVGAVSEPNGNYVLRGLLPGTYRIVAVPFSPLNALNSYWGSSSNSFLPSPLTASGTSPGATTLIRLKGGDEVTGVDLAVEDRDRPFEPDGSTAQATSIPAGGSVASRIESIDDRDYYRFSGKAGQRISILVHSGQIGGDLDPSVDLIAPNQRTILRTSEDIRSDFTYARRLEGPDTDCRILGFRLTEDGDHYIRVRVTTTSGWGLASSFYLLAVTGGLNAPDPDESEYSATPRAIDADGVSTSLIRVVPRNSFGELIGAGVTVELIGSGGGTLSAVSHQGGGVYTATITAPTSPGTDAITVVMDTADGTAEALGAVTLSYVGPASAEASEFTANPRRIPMDGVSSTTVTFVPRDALGQDLGSGRAVTIEFDGPAAGTLGPVVDGGDGSYSAVLTSSTTDARARLIGRIDGVGLGLEVPFGFDLLEVIEDVLADVTALLAQSGTPDKSRKKLEKAARQLADSRAALVGPGAPGADTGAALALVAKAAKSLEAAQKKSKGSVNLEVSHRELAQAARATARGEIDSVATGGDPKREKRLAQAEKKFDKGDVANVEGRYSKAVKRYRSAWQKAAKL